MQRADVKRTGSIVPMTVVLVLTAVFSVSVLAKDAGSLSGYLRTVDYDKLVKELGDGLPTGEGVTVTQVENAAGWKEGQKGWAPDEDSKAFEDITFLLPALPSDHATSVAKRFYGKSAMASGVSEVECYPNTVWALSKTGFLRTRRSVPPLASRSRVANHSWVGKKGHGFNLEVLKRVDFVVETDDFIQVAGANNGSEVPDLLQCCYNAIIVGTTRGRHSVGTNKLGDDLYDSGRTRPDIVAPAGATSSATPVVASAATVLVGFAHERGKDLSNGSYVSPRSGLTIHHAETSEVIRAALMAGADRSGSGISHYRSGAKRKADNGLDSRYGAGCVNIYNSYHILAAGECNSDEDGGDDAGRTGPVGFDYDPAFGGGEDSNRKATYYLRAPGHGEPHLKASLVWNIDANESLSSWDGKAKLHDLDMKLYDLMWSEVLPVAESKSWVDSTENLWVELERGHSYRLVVQVPDREDDFVWDYALAWQYGKPEARQEPEGAKNEQQ